MYQYPKHLKIRVSQLLKCLLTDMLNHQHFIFVDIYLDGPMHFYLGPIIILTKKLKIAIDVVVFVDGPMHFSELSQPLKSFIFRRRFKI